jgi:hypothetical protein
MASIPPTALGDIILSNLKQRLLTPDRLVSLLQSLTDRQHRRGYGLEPWPAARRPFQESWCRKSRST